MVKYLLIIFIFIMALGVVFGQSSGSIDTYGLTSINSRISGNTFTWTLYNNTGSGDGQPGWDVIVWSLRPVDLPEPVSVISPEGWKWTKYGGGRFEVAYSQDKYLTPPAIAPGGSLTFIYEVQNGFELSRLQNSFITHVASVLPEPEDKDGVTKWIQTFVNGKQTWFDCPAYYNDIIPEPQDILPLLLLCTAGLSLTKIIRHRGDGEARDSHWIDSETSNYQPGYLSQ